MNGRKRLAALFAAVIISALPMCSPALGETLDEYFVCRFSWSPAVYTGPAGSYYRAGKAQYGSPGTARVYGMENGWLLIGYETASGRYRLGYVDGEKALQRMYDAPEGAVPRRLSFAYAPVTVARACELTDDPVMTKAPIDSLPQGQEAVFLATMGDAWAYVELRTGSQWKRGFVPLSALSGPGIPAGNDPASRPENDAGDGYDAWPESPYGTESGSNGWADGFYGAEGGSYVWPDGSYGAEDGSYTWPDAPYGTEDGSYTWPDGSYGVEDGYNSWPYGGAASRSADSEHPRPEDGTYAWPDASYGAEDGSYTWPDGPYGTEGGSSVRSDDLSGAFSGDPAPAWEPNGDEPGSAAFSGVWAVANQRLAGRLGPSGNYESAGIFMVQNQVVLVLARHFDAATGVWWVKCQVTGDDGPVLIWTGVKRFYNPDWLLDRLPDE